MEKINNKLVVTQLRNKKQYYVISIVENDFLEMLEKKIEEANKSASRVSEFSQTRSINQKQEIIDTVLNNRGVISGNS